MKLNFSIVLRTLCLAASASASVAHVYLSNPETYPHNVDTTISPSTARSIFAQRLDIAQYHSLGNADAATIAAVNDFGGRPRRLFGNEQNDRRRFLFIIEGSEKAMDVAPGSGGELFAYKIDNPPDSKSNARLLSDLHRQSHACAQHEKNIADNDIQDFWQTTPVATSLDGETLMFAGGRGIAHSNSLEHITSKHGASSPEYRSAVAELRETIDQLFAKAANENWDVAVAVMPPKAPSGLFKRSTPSTWGKYSMPKRQFDGDVDPTLGATISDAVEDAFGVAESALDATIDRPSITDSTVTNKEDKEESLLSEIADFLEDTWDGLTSGDSKSQGVSAAQQSDTSPPRGILPACFSSMSECVRVTHSCSGHGSCILRYTDSSAGSGAGACYACGCNATRYELEDGGVQVTYWTGPACQKKDLSTEFWLIGGTVLALLGASVWGVGLLYSMGSQDLPSVLGAGVAGPRAK